MKWTTIFLACYLLSSSLYASDSEHSVESTFYQARIALERIESIQFESKCKYDLSDIMEREKGAYKNTFISKGQFYEQGGKFRSEASYDDWGSENSHEMYSLYNGEKYQLFNPKTGLLTHSSTCRMNNSSMIQNPILMPYVFFISNNKSSVLSLNNLRNPKSWEDLAQNSVFKGVKQINSYNCVVIDIPMEMSTDNQKGFQRVYFATDLSFFPIQIETWAGNAMIGKLTVEEFERISSTKGVVVVPTAINVSDRDEKERELLRTSITLDIETLKINEPIDESLFEIPATEAVAFVDADLDVSFMINAPPIPITEIVSERTNDLQQKTKSTPISRTIDRSQQELSSADEEEEVTVVSSKDHTANRRDYKNLMKIAIILLMVIFLFLFIRKIAFTKKEK